MSHLSPGAYKSMRKEVQRCRLALTRRRITSKSVEMREDGPYLNGCRVKITTVRALRRELEELNL